MSVTYGAGGSTRDRTHQVVTWIRRETDHHADGPPHLRRAHTRSEIADILASYREAGIENILALGGDPPDEPRRRPPERLHATPPSCSRTCAGEACFSVGVAAHPELHPRSRDRVSDRRYLAAKLARADFAITQFFFEAEHYLRLVDELAALGCDKPVRPRDHAGHQPLAGAAHGPAVGRGLPGVAGRPGRPRRPTIPTRCARIGVEAATQLCSDLLEAGAPGLHFYTLNRSTATREIYASLGLAV